MAAKTRTSRTRQSTKKPSAKKAAAKRAAARRPTAKPRGKGATRIKPWSAAEVREAFERFRNAVRDTDASLRAAFDREKRDAAAGQALLILSRLLFLYFIQQMTWRLMTNNGPDAVGAFCGSNIGLVS